MKKPSSAIFLFHRSASTLAVASGLVGAAFLYAACSDDSSAVKETPTPLVDSGAVTLPDGKVVDPGNLDAGKEPDGAPKDCFDSPVSHLQIINACTDAERIDRAQTKSKKLLADGGLPALP